VIRNFIVAAGVAGFMLSVAGVLVVKIVETREVKQPKWPPPQFFETVEHSPR
jgi:hypothetical protein